MCSSSPGDSRSNEHLGMQVLHTIFLRESNRIATTLHQLNPQWSGEILYHETRKIIGAYLQVSVSSTALLCSFNAGTLQDSIPSKDRTICDANSISATQNGGHALEFCSPSIISGGTYLLFDVPCSPKSGSQ